MHFQHTPEIWRHFPNLVPGLLVIDGIHPDAETAEYIEAWYQRARRRLEEVFGEFASEAYDYNFDKTKIMVAELKDKNVALEQSACEINKLNEGLLNTLAEVVDLRDPYVLGHSQGVTELATKLARRMGLHERQVELVRKGSLLHDIGKLGIPQSILAKPGKLTTEECQLVMD